MDALPDCLLGGVDLEIMHRLRGEIRVRDKEQGPSSKARGSICPFYEVALKLLSLAVSCLRPALIFSVALHTGLTRSHDKPGETADLLGPHRPQKERVPLHVQVYCLS